MKPKTILIIEDEDAQRISLDIELQTRGFNVLTAADIVSSRKLLNEHGQKADVAVLDMNFENPSEPGVTGADLGIEFLRRNKRKASEGNEKTSTPEFLILTAHNDKIDYYQKAIDLDVAAYLYKVNSPPATVVSHIRALAIRHALNTEGENGLDEIVTIAERSSNRFDAIAQYCERVLAPEFEGVVGAPFVILLGNGQKTVKCGGESELPHGFHQAYSNIQGLAHGQSNFEVPFIFDEKQFYSEMDNQAFTIYRRLNGAAFLPYWVGKNLRLTIGILQDVKDEYPLPENPEIFAKILDQYLRASILEHSIDILTRMTFLKTQRETVIRETSKFCTYMGQQQLSLLAEAKDNNSVDATSIYFKEMKSLAEDLRLIGEVLWPLRTKNEEFVLEKEKQSAPESVNVKTLIDEAWQEISNQIVIKQIHFINRTTSQDFLLLTQRDEILLAFIRVLQWMIQRSSKMQEDVIPKIKVDCQQADDSLEIIFEDSSYRLSKILRQHLFEPFTQSISSIDWQTNYEDMDDEIIGERLSNRTGRYLPLYLAKTLIEGKNGGKLEDKTDKLAGNIGHRLVMSIRLANAQQTTLISSSAAGVF